MKVFTESEGLLGKKLYKDERIARLSARFAPKKTTFISIEFTDEFSASCECIVATKEKLSDYIIQDYEKVSGAIARDSTKTNLQEAAKSLENEMPLFGNVSNEIIETLKEYGLKTVLPCVLVDNDAFTVALAEKILTASSLISFFTVNKNEVRAWILRKGLHALDAAAKIHTDIAKGFIKAQVYNISHLDEYKNPQDAQAKGILSIADKEYVLGDGDIITIQFKK